MSNHSIIMIVIISFSSQSNLWNPYSQKAKFVSFNYFYTFCGRFILGYSRNVCWKKRFSSETFRSKEFCLWENHTHVDVDSGRLTDLHEAFSSTPNFRSVEILSRNVLEGNKLDFIKDKYLRPSIQVRDSSISSMS